MRKEMQSKFLIGKARIITPLEIIEDAYVSVEGDLITRIVDKTEQKIKTIELPPKMLIFPGLVNPHDHLMGTYLPKVGLGPYLNWKGWDDDLKSSDIFFERNKNPRDDIYLLGTYRHILSGVTTVSDHIPHVINDDIIPKLPIRVPKEYTLAHEVSSFDLKWGDGFEIEHERALKNNFPFITHIEEGFDEESMKGIDYLLDAGCLTEHTVLIHGIGFSDKDIKEVAKHKAHLVWCPDSNFFMFEKTARIKELISAGANISIGTDSPMSGSINLLEEIRFAKKLYYDMYEEELSDFEITKMITVNAAKALRLDDKVGSIEAGKKCDLLIVKDKKNDPYKTLLSLKPEDISLVIYDGKPIYGDEEFVDFFKNFSVDFTKIHVNNQRKLITGDPLSLLARIRKTIGYNKEFEFLPIY